MTRKLVSLTLCVAVIAAFALPSTALARGGAGKKPGAGKAVGHANKGGGSAKASKAPKATGSTKVKAAKAGEGPQGHEAGQGGEDREGEEGRRSSSPRECGEDQAAHRAGDRWHRRVLGDEPVRRRDQDQGRVGLDTTPTAFGSITKNILKRMEKGEFVPPRAHERVEQVRRLAGSGRGLPPWVITEPPTTGSNDETVTPDGSENETVTPDGSGTDRRPGRIGRPRRSPSSRCHRLAYATAHNQLLTASGLNGTDPLEWRGPSTLLAGGLAWPALHVRQPWSPSASHVVFFGQPPSRSLRSIPVERSSGPTSTCPSTTAPRHGSISGSSWSWASVAVVYLITRARDDMYAWEVGFRAVAAPLWLSTRGSVLWPRWAHGTSPDRSPTPSPRR